MNADAGDELEFYPCLVDGLPASIYVNLRFERALPAGADHRYELAIRMREAGPHGIGTAEEAEALNAAEESLIERAASLGLVYVGRLRHHGTWEVTFYGPAGQLTALRDAAANVAGGRPVDALAEHDPTWSYYRELLLPDAERRRWMEDRRLVQVLRDQGDMLTVRRRVDHDLAFPSAESRAAFVKDAEGLGFTQERTSEGDDPEMRFGVRVARADAIELDHLHDVVMSLVDAAAAHGGRYDRWTTSIEP